ncbi:MAG: hypothetical protein A4E58_03353 [Syntrophorhabdus sp. PtaB.Bin006]|nr:MAG: hypothetical protein A4E58_03353 [Syntrophorhabdus sp. PtaB.Bin006]
MIMGLGPRLIIVMVSATPFPGKVRLGDLLLRAIHGFLETSCIADNN